MQCFTHAVNRSCFSLCLEAMGGGEEGREKRIKGERQLEPLELGRNRKHSASSLPSTSRSYKLPVRPAQATATLWFQKPLVPQCLEPSLPPAVQTVSGGLPAPCPVWQSWLPLTSLCISLQSWMGHRADDSGNSCDHWRNPSYGHSPLHHCCPVLL